MGTRHSTLSIAIVLVFAMGQPAGAQLAPDLAYVGVNRPIPMRVAPPPDADAHARLEVALFDAGGVEIAHSVLVGAGAVDLAALFPSIWTSATWPLCFAQLIVDGVQVGPPVVIQPLDTPALAEDGLTSRVRSSDVPLRELAALPKAMRDKLAEETVIEQPTSSLRNGVYLWVDQRIILDTDAGEIEIALRPDVAPNTCRHVLKLTQGGLYQDMPFHRVIAADPQGRAFIIQTGDPTGTGAGGCGESIDFEASTLPHDFGVVSMARKPDDPNSASSQFFICLSREGCAALDGRFTAFGTVVQGEDAIATIAATPTGANGRPIDPPMVRRAYTIDAPTIAERTAETPIEPVATEPAPR